MRNTKVLLIEGARNNGTSFAVSLHRKYEVRIAHSGNQGLSMALDRRPDVIVLDAASLRTSGDRICERLRARLGEVPIIHIQPKEIHRGDSAADVLLHPPFTARKLINRIERYAIVPEAPVLEVGTFSLNLEQQTLNAPWIERKLTPKLAALMELFMRNPNQTLERKTLMQGVWKTDYMGDTRTLDVHIRWLRKVVEPDPRQPRYITTVRGQGYRFVTENDTEAKPPETLVEPTPEKPEKKAAGHNNPPNTKRHPAQ